MRISDWSSDVCSSDLDVDLFLATALGSGYEGAFFPFGRDLGLHGAQYFGRRGKVLDLVAQHFHAPIVGGLVERRNDGAVYGVALFERAVQLHLADRRTPRGLRQLRNCRDIRSEEQTY